MDSTELFGRCWISEHEVELLGGLSSATELGIGRRQVEPNARRGVKLESVAVPAKYTNVRSKMHPVSDVFRICMLTMHYRYLCEA